MCDSYGIHVHVVTSEQAAWYLVYQPQQAKVAREIFLTYISPIHYNAIRCGAGREGHGVGTGQGGAPKGPSCSGEQVEHHT